MCIRKSNEIKQLNISAKSSEGKVLILQKEVESEAERCQLYEDIIKKNEEDIKTYKNKIKEMEEVEEDSIKDIDKLSASNYEECQSYNVQIQMYKEKLQVLSTKLNDESEKRDKVVEKLETSNRKLRE